MESESFFEKYPLSVRAMMRLQADTRIIDDHAGLLFSVITYLEAELGSESLTGKAMDRAVESGAVIDLKRFESNKRQGLEWFRMTPLELVAPYVDVTMPLADIEEWYKHAAALAVEELEPTHSDVCLKRGSWKDYTCDDSLICPKRKTRHLLMGGICNADFESLEYQFDEERVYKLNEVKKRVAIQTGVISEVDASMYWQIYEQRRLHAMEQK